MKPGKSTRRGVRVGTRRAQSRLRLAWSWIVSRRPDVAEAIKAEAAKQFPYDLTRKGITGTLPKSLEALK